MVVRCRLMIVTQMIVGSSAQKISYWNLGQILVAHIESPDGKRVILRFVGGEGKVAVSSAHIWLELHGGHEFLHGRWKLLLLHQRAAKLLVKFCIVGVGCEQGAVNRFGFSKLPRLDKDIGQIALRSWVVRYDLQSRL